MQFTSENVKELISCTCLRDNHDMEPEDLKDADLCDPTCPIHGVRTKIAES